LLSILQATNLETSNKTARAEEVDDKQINQEEAEAGVSGAVSPPELPRFSQGDGPAFLLPSTSSNMLFQGSPPNIRLTEAAMGLPKFSPESEVDSEQMPEEAMSLTRKMVEVRANMLDRSVREQLQFIEQDDESAANIPIKHRESVLALCKMPDELLMMSSPENEKGEDQCRMRCEFVER